MRSNRPVSINNSLVHGICNCNCRLCGVNKDTYSGPKAFQSAEVTRKIIERCREAAREGIAVRYVANAGDGEPTLHPSFASRIDLFAGMIQDWDHETIPPPEVSVVSNGQTIGSSSVLDALINKPVTLILSFPTSHPAHYGAIMTGRPEAGEFLLGRATAAIEKSMALRASGALQRLQFHISPPERDLIRADFADTVEFLSSRAARARLASLELVLFPATSNRSGLVDHGIHTIDLYKDLFRKYNRSVFRGIRLELSLSVKRFFPRNAEIIDLLRRFNYPCIWNSQLFLTADGTSICPNDQAVRNPLGNIMTSSVQELMETKEDFEPGPSCKACDQNPGRMRGSAAASLYSWIARGRIRAAGKRAGRAGAREL